jgi:DNA repair exonuclease SbcCD ATPase subunit
MAENLFPLIPNLQEQVDNINNEINNKTLLLGRVFKFDFDNNKFVVKDGKLVEIDNDIEKIEQWISGILRTYKNKYGIYKGTEFYCNIEDIIGKKLNGYYLAEMKREIEEALLKHRYIKSVDNFSVTQAGRKWNIQYTITLIDGTNIASNGVVI